jgi:hypothetical protein
MRANFVLRLVPPPLLGDRFERQHYRPIDQVRADGNVLDPIDGDKPATAEQDFVRVGVELALTGAAARRQPADGIAQPVWETTHVVE